MALNESNEVRKQYQTATNLKTRLNIHEKYSTNKQGFANFIYSHYSFENKMNILELGCGTGDMWKERISSLPEGIRLYLTDFSEGMLSYAKENLGEQKNISFHTVNIEQIPFPTNTFDRVIANMMLYHVQDLSRGLSEVSRVLKENGEFSCATYGENGIAPFLAGLLNENSEADTTNKNFTLQNGEAILRNFFGEVERKDYIDSLEVTEIDDLVDYALSLTKLSFLGGKNREELKTAFQSHMKNGVLKVPKEYGMFICRSPFRKCENG